MKKDEKTDVPSDARKVRRYNVSQVGKSLDTAMASEMQPLDAMVHDLKDKFIAGLDRGYSIADLVLMVQEAGVDASDRQIRYAFAKAGVRRKKQKSGSVRGAVKPPSKQQDGGFIDKDGVRSAGVSAPAIPQMPSGSDRKDVQPDSGSIISAAQTAAGAAGGNVQGGEVRGSAVPQSAQSKPESPAPSGSAGADMHSASKTAFGQAAPPAPPKTEAPAERKAPPSQEEGLTAAEEEGTALPAAPSDRAGHRVQIERRPI